MVKPAIVPATPTRVREAPIEKRGENAATVVASCGEFNGDGEEWSLNITGQPLTHSLTHSPVVEK